ncbi:MULTISPECIES: hypothetical protein [unclassified Microcoleus]|nr:MULTISPECIES: hypothetical protein [unclassified Microcoleus]
MRTSVRFLAADTRTHYEPGYQGRSHSGGDRTLNTNYSKVKSAALI